MKSLLESRFAVFLLCIMLAISPLLFAQNKTMGPTELELQKLLQDVAFKHGEVAFFAVNLDNGKVIAEHNSQRAMIPASVQKLITTGAALEKLGTDHTFETSFAHTGVISNDGILNGNLIITPMGDPTFDSENSGLTEEALFAKIKKELTDKKISQINGKIVFDLTYYNAHNTPRGMLWEDMGNYFGATPTSLMWQNNMVKLDLRSAQVGTPVLLASKLSPSFPFNIDLQLTAADNNRDNAWFFGAPGSNNIYAKGTIPAKREHFSVKISNPNPAFSFATSWLSYMQWQNTEVQYLTEKVIFEVTPLFSITSKPLSTIIKETNMHSINLFADALCTELDPKSSEKSLEGGLETIQTYLTSQKVKISGTRMLDGSGISPMNRLTAQSLVDFLGAMYRSKNFDTYFKSLPVAGESGTIKNYFGGTKAQGNLRAKSGTMTGTRNYAGYVTNKYQENIAFCIMMNDFDEGRKTAIMDRVQLLLNALIED
jgi:serine-type D-Ala-D-Ala carboxypeptidase/endopeptidase (penicillin-binding protein 4)